jgi:hypothetical protein
MTCNEQAGGAAEARALSLLISWMRRPIVRVGRTVDDRRVTDEPTAFVPHDDHVRLLAGTDSSGGPVYELIPAALVEPGVYDVVGSPGLACGCAAGDRIRVASDGQFDVIRRGGNLCLVVVPRRPAGQGEITALRSAFDRLGGLVEMPANGRFIVITVPIAAGFPAVEEAASAWAASNEAEWYFGNVHDENDRPLNWWAD